MNARERAEQCGTTHDAMRQRQRRLRGLLQDLMRELETGSYSRHRLDRLRERFEEARKRFRVNPTIAREIWKDLEAAFRTGLLGLPAFLWKRLRAALDRWNPTPPGTRAG